MPCRVSSRVATFTPLLTWQAVCEIEQRDEAVLLQYNTQAVCDILPVLLAAAVEQSQNHRTFREQICNQLLPHRHASTPRTTIRSASLPWI